MVSNNCISLSLSIDLICAHMNEAVDSACHFACLQQHMGPIDVVLCELKIVAK